MPPKRREKEVEASKSVKTEATGDHELFLNAFEKPTQIYRYLRNRSLVKPYFLHRNLVYMQHRMTRRKKNGKKISPDNLLEIVQTKQLQQKSNDLKTSGYLTLTYLGFYNQNNLTPKEPVKLETILLKVCHQKRKELSHAVLKEPCPCDMELSDFASQLDLGLNRSELNCLLSEFDQFCSNSITFDFNDDQDLDEASVNAPDTLPHDNSESPDRACYHQVSLGTSYVAYNPSDENPPPKVPTVSIPAESFYYCGPKVKSSTILLRIVTNSAEHVMTSNSEESEPNPKKIRLSKDSNDTVEFGMDLVVFDKHQRCSLKEGQYEFLLSEIDKRSNNDRCTRISTSFSSWEDLGEDKDMSKQHFSSFENISKGPTLKFHLQWAKEPVTSIVDRPPAFIPSPDEPVKPKIEINNVVDTKFQESKTIIYQFSYNNSKSHQHTEASNDLICPWCWLNCITVFSLLWHLKLCHPRFNFHFTQVNKGMKIEVSLNENYDGSYSGCPTNPPRPGRPVKRTSLTHVMVCHPKRTKMKSLSELTDLEENDHENHRPYITGHNRLYHHATTCLPINPKEMDIDSEDEMDPRWLKQKTMMMIDEFTDVNEGEKELMKMWNLHVMKHGSVFVGDCQVPLACFMFLEEKGEELLRKNLYRNFVMHMCLLFDYGLVSPVTVFHVMEKLQDLIQNNPDINKELQESWHLQKEHWNPVDQKPVVDLSESVKSPGIGVNAGDSGQRRKPNSEKKLTPKKSNSTVNGVDKRIRQSDARRRLSLPSKPELRRKVLKESTSSAPGPFRRRSVNNDPPAMKKKPETERRIDLFFARNHVQVLNWLSPHIDSTSEGFCFCRWRPVWTQT